MKFILLMAMAALLCGRGALAQGPDATSLSQLQGAEREQRLVAGARREGEVSVFTSLVSEDMAALAAAFESRYGVKRKYWRAPSRHTMPTSCRLRSSRTASGSACGSTSSCRRTTPAW